MFIGMLSIFFHMNIMLYSCLNICKKPRRKWTVSKVKSALVCAAAVLAFGYGV